MGGGQNRDNHLGGRGHTCVSVHACKCLHYDNANDNDQEGAQNLQGGKFLPPPPPTP